MKLGLQYLAISLLVGIIAGLFLSSFVETPLNPTKEVTLTNTTTVTTTTTKTKILSLWSYSLRFSAEKCGPYWWGFDLSINQNGSALLNYRQEKTGTISRNLTKSDLDNLGYLFVKANIFAMNSYYGQKPQNYDQCRYNLDLNTFSESGIQTKSISWWMKPGAVDSTPEELHEVEYAMGRIESYMMNTKLNPIP